MGKWLDRSLLRLPFCYQLCVGQKSFEKALKSLAVPRSDWPQIASRAEADAAVHWFEHGEGGEKVALVSMRKPKGRSDVEIFGLLTHEAVHIWQEARQDIGEREPSSEFEAYSIQWIAQQLMAAYVATTTKKEGS